MNSVSHKPGDIVKLAGIDFVVLDNLEDDDLFLLAVNNQGESRFGDSNNYAESDLKEAVDEWLYRLTEKIEEKHGGGSDFIKHRTIDLMTLDGYKGYGKLEVAAAPLTLDEYRKYADIIPNGDDWSWMATGWGRPGNGGAAYAWSVNSHGDYGNGGCSYSGGIRPALVLSSSLFDSEKKEADLTEVSTDALINELRRRIEGAMV